VLTLDGTKVVFDNGWWFRSGVGDRAGGPALRGDLRPRRRRRAARAEARAWHGKIMAWLREEITRAIA
jgi:hypothetical protein